MKQIICVCVCVGMWFVSLFIVGYIIEQESEQQQIELEQQIKQLEQQLEQERVNIDMQKNMIKEIVHDKAEKIKKQLTEEETEETILPERFARFRIVLEIEPKTPYTQNEIFAGVNQLCRAVMVASSLHKIQAIAVAGQVNFNDKSKYVILEPNE